MCLSRRELADAVTAYLAKVYGRSCVVTGSYIGDLERGDVRWPRAAYRVALRAVLGACSDAELGFFISREDLHPDAQPAAPGQLQGGDTDGGAAVG